MIISIQEKHREPIESQFGSIIEYKRFIFKTGLYGLGEVDYGELLNSVSNLRVVCSEAYKSLSEAFKELSETLLQAVRPISSALSDLAKCIESITPIEYSNPDYMHPPEIHPPVMNIGRVNTLPHVPKQKIYRNRNNC